MTSSSIFQFQTICLVESENSSLIQMLRGFDGVPGRVQTVKDRLEALGVDGVLTLGLMVVVCWEVTDIDAHQVVSRSLSGQITTLFFYYCGPSLSHSSTWRLFNLA